METNENSKLKSKSPFQQKVLERIRAVRTEKGFSQQKVAELLDATNGQIGNIESPKQPHKYTLAQISTLCKEFQCSINYIFTGRDTCSQDDLIAAIVRYEEKK